MTEGQILTQLDLASDAAGSTMQDFDVAQTDAVRFAVSATCNQKTSAGTSAHARRVTPSLPSAYITLCVKSEDVMRCDYAGEWVERD